MTTILEEPIGESNMVKLPGHVYKNISVLCSQLYNYLFIIYPTENATFKIHFFLIFIP